MVLEVNFGPNQTIYNILASIIDNLDNLPIKEAYSSTLVLSQQYCTHDTMALTTTGTATIFSRFCLALFEAVLGSDPVADDDLCTLGSN